MDPCRLGISPSLQGTDRVVAAAGLMRKSASKILGLCFTALVWLGMGLAIGAGGAPRHTSCLMASRIESRVRPGKLIRHKPGCGAIQAFDSPQNY